MHFRRVTALRFVSNIVRLISSCGRLLGLLALAVAWSSSAGAQLPVSRADAMRAAVTAGTRFALARADTSAARGRLITVNRSGSINNNVNTTYNIDKAENRLNKTTTGSPNPP